jgi:signal transduction histidine kinase
MAGFDLNRWENAHIRAVDAIVGIVVVVGIAGLFVFDVTHPRGEVDGVGYAALVALCIRFGNRTLVGCAIFTTILTVVASIFLPNSGISIAGMWANRGFAVAEIWIIAALLLRRLSLEAYIHDRESRLRSHQTALAQIVRDALLSDKPFEDRLHCITEICSATLQTEYTAVLQGRARASTVRILDTYQRSIDRHISVPDQPLNQLIPYRERMRDELVVLADDVLKSPFHAERLDFFGNFGIRAIMVADMFTDQPGQGAVAFAHRKPHHWSEQEIAFARGAASVVSLLIASNRNVETFAAIDLVSEGIYAEDDDGTIQYANRAARQFASNGAQSDEPGYPRPAVSLVGSRDFHEIVFDGRDLEIERVRLPNGGLITRINDATERNVTLAEHRRLEARVQQSEKMEAIGQLAGGVAHDFNNIIGAIRGFAGFLVQDLPEQSAERGFADRIVGACERGKDLVEQILAFARSKTVERGVVDLGLLLTRNREFLTSLLPTQIALRTDIQNCSLPVFGSSVQIGQLMTNLCINARDALENTEGVIDIIARRASTEEMSSLKNGGEKPGERGFGEIQENADYCLLRVTDSGPGIPSNILDHIFEPFFTTTGRHRGTGLGLAVVHGVVESTGGVCQVQTLPGEGTVFSIYFPLVGGAALTEVPKVSGPRNLRGRERVLIVDDERDIADMMAIGLERLGYETVGVNDPLEALSAIAEDPQAFDIVITDQVMPALRGLDLIKKLKEIKPEIKAVLCTGYSDGANEQVSRAAGADAFFHKPVDARELAPTLRMLMEGPGD